MSAMVTLLRALWHFAGLVHAELLLRCFTRMHLQRAHYEKRAAIHRGRVERLLDTL